MRHLALWSSTMNKQWNKEQILDGLKLKFSTFIPATNTNQLK